MNSIVRASINKIPVDILADEGNIKEFKKIVSLMRMIVKDNETLKQVNSKLTKEIETLKESNSTIKGRNKLLEKENIKCKEGLKEAIENKALVEKANVAEREKNNTLSMRLQLYRSYKIADEEQYEMFKVQYLDMTSTLEKLALKIKELKDKYKCTKEQLLMQHWGADRMKLQIRSESLEHEINVFTSEYEKELKSLKKTEFMKFLFEKQTEEVKKTMIRLGWLDTDMSFEYRLGILYDTARAHNLRELLAVADYIINKNLKLVRSTKMILKPAIPIRSLVMRESLRQDCRAEPMSKISTAYKPEIKTIFQDLSVELEDVDINVKFPSLPKYNTIEKLTDEINSDDELEGFRCKHCHRRGIKYNPDSSESTYDSSEDDYYY